MNSKKQVLFFTSLAIIMQGTLVLADAFDDHIINNHANSDGPDYVQHEAAGNGWFSNLGPTGIRAMLTDDEGKVESGGGAIQYVVKYVFPGSPADGLVMPGDVIIGVNGSAFENAYVYGYWNGFGYDGPLTDFGRAVEESEKNLDGRLTLMVLRNGKAMNIEVQIESEGAFGETFPYNCSKSESLRTKACQKLIELQKSNGSWPGAAHASFLACFALMAQGDTYMDAVEKYLDLASQTTIQDSLWNWHLAFRAILMSEYQMMTGNEKYRDYMLGINDQLKRNGTRFKNHTYGHVGLDPGNLGYGSMKGATNLVLLGWAMMEKAGIPIHADAIEKTLIEMDMAGCDGYGWPNDAEPIGPFDSSVVTARFGNLHRNIEELWNVARTAGFPHGNSALLHRIRPWQRYSPTYVTYLTNRTARCRNVMITGHGSAMLHGWSTFTALCMASNRGDAELLRLTLDYNIGLLNSSRCFDGGFYTQHSRDAKGGDLRNGSRTTATALWLTVLSAPQKQLRLLGAMDDPNAPTVFAGNETMTWSGEGVLLAPVVVEEPGSDWTELTYAWTAEPADGVVFTDSDNPGNPTPSEVKNPIVTITKETDDPSVVTLTLAVNNLGREGAPVEDAMSVYVYDDACKMVRIGQGKAAEHPTDLDGNCITDLVDFSKLASEWLLGEALPAPIWK